MNARILTSSVLAVAAWVGIGASARADRLDQKSLDQAPRIAESIQSRGNHTSHGIHGKHTPAALRNLIFKEVKRRDDDNNNAEKPTNADSTMVDKIEFKLLSEGQPVAIKAASNNNNKQMQIQCPDASKPVVFRIDNKGDKRLGVDVKLNGTSLLLRQSASSEACRLWVLEPGKSYELRGYYDETEQKNVAPFQILTGDAAKTAREQLGDKAGEILIDVFEEVTDVPAPTEEMLISIRGLRGVMAKGVRHDLHTLQRILMRGAMVKRVVKTESGKKRELIVEDTDETKKVSAALKAVDFKKGSSAIASQIIKVVPAAGANAQTAEKTNANPMDKAAPKASDNPMNKAADKANGK